MYAGIHWISMDFHWISLEFQWISIGFHRNSNGFPLDFIGFLMDSGGWMLEKGNASGPSNFLWYGARTTALGSTANTGMLELKATTLAPGESRALGQNALRSVPNRYLGR